MDIKESSPIWLINFLIKRLKAVVSHLQINLLLNKSAISQNEQLAEQLHKLIIRKFKEKESIFSIQRQYLGCRFSRYAIKK